mgnify:CR=1 FL=1
MFPQHIMGHIAYPQSIHAEPTAIHTISGTPLVVACHLKMAKRTLTFRYMKL